MPDIVLGREEKESRAPAEPHALAVHASRFFFGAGAVLFLGVLFDVFTLWVFQRQDTVQWEFVALNTTTNAFPMLLVSAALMYGALVVGRSDSIRAYRTLAIVVIFLGVAGLFVGFLLGTNYLALQSLLPQESKALFRSMAVKGGGVSAVFGLVTLVVGALGLRSPRPRS